MSNNILSEIQGRLKAPKSQFNSFGGYKYRSMEDINEALKPLLSEYKCDLIVTDEIVYIGEWHYIKAIARLRKNKEAIAETWGYAREEATKKGMDSSQITGAASSYARKYALNGMFLIDDSKDADALQGQGEGKRERKQTKPAPPRKEIPKMKPPAPMQPATPSKADRLKLSNMLKLAGYNDKSAMLAAINSRDGVQVEDSKDLTIAQVKSLTEHFSAVARLLSECRKAGAVSEDDIAACLSAASVAAGLITIQQPVNPAAISTLLVKALTEAVKGRES